MTKFNLTDETVKVGDLKLDKSQFDIPKKGDYPFFNGLLQSIKNINGESIATDEVAKNYLFCTRYRQNSGLERLGLFPLMTLRAFVWRL